MNIIISMEIVATILVIVGVWMIGTPNITGQWLMLVAQIIWSTYALMTKQYFFTIQSIVLIGFSIRALYRWKKQGVGKSGQQNNNT